MKVMYKEYAPIKREIKGISVSEELSYNLESEKLYIKFASFPTSLEVELVGKDPDLLDKDLEVMDFKGLPDGNIDYISMDTHFHEIPVVDAFKEKGELHLVLLKPTNSILPTNEWIELNEKNVTSKSSYREMSFDWIDEDDKLNEFKNMKKEELSNYCKETIQQGFYYKSYIYSYGLDNQQNFTDTMRLFENNMIDSTGWNAYVGEEKVRIQLNKMEFTQVYLAGVKHKTNCLTRLNDVLYPLVDAAENKETIARIYWDTGLPAEELSLKEGESIDDQIGQLNKKDKDLEQANMMTMMALVQISGQMK